MLESDENSSAGSSPNSSAIVFRLGDDASDRQFRAILSFNTAGLPDNAAIVSVTLQIRKAGLAGKDPFSMLGNIVADIRKGSFNGSTSLQAEDFQARASRNAAITILDTPMSDWYAGSMDSANFRHINLKGVTQFRLRFAKGDNDNLAANYLKFYSGNSSATAGYRPTLLITYTLP